jgi:hypothetical protein
MSVKQKMSDGIVGFGHFLGNDSPHNFCNLGREFLDAAKYTHTGFKYAPKWPTYFLVFQSLENFLKAYLLAHGATLDYVKKKVGHRLCDGFAEAKAKGLIVDAPQEVEDAILATSRDYTARDFQYRSIGEWPDLIKPNVAIAYVEAVSKVVNY